MSEEIKRLLNQSGFQKRLSELAEAENKSLQAANKEAETYLKEVYAAQEPTVNLFGVLGAEYILSRGYDKTIDVRADEMKKITKLMRKGSVAFVMTHKTYIDMFVLGVALARHGLPVPYIFAGINMAFVGLGQLGRQAGTIFIRRSFKDNNIYKASLRHFLADLVNRGKHFMWAIEGTRSRTGKLVWPRLGILKYIAEAAGRTESPVAYVPVSIVYDLIPDVEDMTKEGRGQDKRPESLQWFINYVYKMGQNLGRISVRFGEPVTMTEASQDPKVEIVDNQVGNAADAQSRAELELPRFAFELVYRINEITPVTTASLVCTTLLSRYSADKLSLESDVAALMQLLETNKEDILVDRAKPLGETIQIALGLLLDSGVIQQVGQGVNAQYALRPENYLMAVYYSNMAVHQLVHRALNELAIVKLVDCKPSARMTTFWEEIMALRDLFKFEFFYSRKPEFSDEIEADLKQLDPDWQKRFKARNFKQLGILQRQQILVAYAVLAPYIEAYYAVAFALRQWDTTQAFDEKAFLDICMLLGEKLNWQGKILRVEAVSKPFLLNGIRLARHRGLIPTAADDKREPLTAFMRQLEELQGRVLKLQEIVLEGDGESEAVIPLEREIVPEPGWEAWRPRLWPMRWDPISAPFLISIGPLSTAIRLMNFCRPVSAAAK